MSGKIADSSASLGSTVSSLSSVSEQLGNAWKGQVSTKFFTNLDSITSNLKTIESHLSVYEDVQDGISDIEDINAKITQKEKERAQIVQQMSNSEDGGASLSSTLSSIDKEIEDLKQKKENLKKSICSQLMGISTGVLFVKSPWKITNNNNLLKSNLKSEDFSGNVDKNDKATTAANDTSKTSNNSNLSGLIGTVVANTSNYNNNAAPGQCVWYVRGRAVEKTGKDTGAIGNGNEMALNCNEEAKLAPSMDNLKEDVILSYRYGTSSAGQKYGHVIYIEGVNGDTVYYTECKSGGKAAGTVKSATKEELFNGTAGCGREVVGLIDVNKL